MINKYSKQKTETETETKTETETETETETDLGSRHSRLAARMQWKRPRDFVSIAHASPTRNVHPAACSAR